MSARYRFLVRSLPIFLRRLRVFIPAMRIPAFRARCHVYS
jgi:hypothetical protein